MSTRSKRKSQPLDSKESVINKRIENSWIFLTKESLLENDNFSIITLPNPAQGSPSKYCLDKAHLKIYEIVTFSEPYRSWFINESVISDGSITMMTPINPLFLVLPRFRNQCSSRAMPLEDLLSEKGFDKILDFIGDLNSIGDLKGPEDLKAYKYNEEKTLTWLEQRIRKLAQVLRAKNIHVTSGAISSTYVTSSVNSENVDEEFSKVLDTLKDLGLEQEIGTGKFYLKYAHGIISDYLEDQLVELLAKRFDFKSDLIEYVGNKRKSEMGEANESNKKIKYEDETETENKFSLNYCIPENKKPKQLSSKEKARQKAASGTKTISSFFSKKS